MKKYTLILFVAVICSVIGVSNVYAVNGNTFTPNNIQMGDTTTLNYNLSKNVSMQFGSHLSGTVADAYAICTYHSSGDRTIGTGSFDQKVFYKTELSFPSGYTTGACAAPADASTSNFAGTADWSAL